MGILDKLLLGFSLSSPIPEHLLGNLKKYRYNSQDNSLLSKYVLCHYWNALTQLFPLTVAYQSTRQQYNCFTPISIAQI
jgi:hypothetical protein